jgi:hypothetical protein
MDAINTLCINIKADSLEPGTYQIDSRNGSVSIYQNGGKSQIATLGYGFFSFIVYAKNKTSIDGAFEGSLSNPLKGNLQNITGSYANLVVN